MTDTAVEEILTQLEALGNETVRARNSRNGAGDNQFGVMLGDIRKIAKKIRSNHALALALWETENLEARLLAMLIIDPKELSIDQMDQMVRAAGIAQLADWFAANVTKHHPRKDTLRQMWMAADNPWAARAGWGLTSELIANGAQGLDLPALLDRIHAQMPAAAPEAQWTMNFCLAGIGIHFPEHRQRALEMGEEMGIYRDFPTPKGCTSPFAPLWIHEMVSRQR